KGGSSGSKGNDDESSESSTHVQSHSISSDHPSHSTSIVDQHTHGKRDALSFGDVFVCVIVDGVLGEEEMTQARQVLNVPGKIPIVISHSGVVKHADTVASLLPSPALVIDTEIIPKNSPVARRYECIGEGEYALLSEEVAAKFRTRLLRGLSSFCVVISYKVLEAFNKGRPGEDEGSVGKIVKGTKWEGVMMNEAQLISSCIYYWRAWVVPSFSAEVRKNIADRDIVSLLDIISSVRGAPRAAASYCKKLIEKSHAVTCLSDVFGLWAPVAAQLNLNRGIFIFSTAVGWRREFVVRWMSGHCTVDSVDVTGKEYIRDVEEEERVEKKCEGEEIGKTVKSFVPPHVCVTLFSVNCVCVYFVGHSHSHAQREVSVFDPDIEDESIVSQDSLPSCCCRGDVTDIGEEIKACLHHAKSVDCVPVLLCDSFSLEDIYNLVEDASIHPCVVMDTGLCPSCETLASKSSSLSHRSCSYTFSPPSYRLALWRLTSGPGVYCDLLNRQIAGAVNNAYARERDGIPAALKCSRHVERVSLPLFSIGTISSITLPYMITPVRWRRDEGEEESTVGYNIKRGRSSHAASSHTSHSFAELGDRPLILNQAITCIIVKQCVVMLQSLVKNWSCDPVPAVIGTGSRVIDLRDSVLVFLPEGDLSLMFCENVCECKIELTQQFIKAHGLERRVKDILGGKKGEGKIQMMTPPPDSSSYPSTQSSAFASYSSQGIIVKGKDIFELFLLSTEPMKPSLNPSVTHTTNVKSVTTQVAETARSGRIPIVITGDYTKAMFKYLRTYTHTAVVINSGLSCVPNEYITVFGKDIHPLCAAPASKTKASRRKSHV
ncbi:hypothetical protein ADUPG1_008278, partial [Aduncisulcus paluster]